MVSERAKRIPPFIVMDVLERAKTLEAEGKPIIHLEIGEPDFPTPRRIINAGIAALRHEKTHYTHSLGILPLRQEIALYYSEKYNREIFPKQIIVTLGTSPALLLILSALLDPDDEVILANPGYACYPNFVEYLGGKPVFVDVYEEDGFQLRAEAIEKKLSTRSKAIMINSPSNPTGNLLKPSVLEAIASMKPYIISDEIYHGLVYGEKEHSILEFTDHAFVLNGFSKLYAMTGWRLGCIIAPPIFVRPIQKLQQNLFICANSFVQWAGVAALKEQHPEILEMVKIYDERRKFMIQRLREIGFRIAVEPTGAFYVFANAGCFHTNSYQFAFELLERTCVAVAPGIDFGSNGEGYLRFSYANSLDHIELAMERLEKYLK